MKKIGFETKIIGILVILSAISFYFDNAAKNLAEAIKNNFFDVILSFFSTKFLFFFTLLILSSLYLYYKDKKQGILPLWISFAIAFIASYILKFIFQRPRIGIEMFVFGLPDFSFPSSHAALAFAVLGVIDEEFRELMWAWLVVAVLTAVSRVYFSYHYLSDVMFGALIGYTIGYFVNYYFEKEYTKRHGKKH